MDDLSASREERTIAFQAHLLDLVQDANIATDEDFHITFQNRAAEALFCWTPTEATGKTTFELLHPIVQEPSMDEAIAKLMKDDIYVGEVFYRRYRELVRHAPTWSDPFLWILCRNSRARAFPLRATSRKAGT